MLDLEKLRKKVSGPVEVEVSPEDGDDYSCGDRAIAAVKHGDGEAFEEAILDIIAKATNK